MRVKSFLARALSLHLAIGMISPAFAAEALQPSAEVAIAPNVDTRALVKANPEYVKTLSEMLKSVGAKKVTCTSGYRSPEAQAAACRRICGDPNGCHNPDRCAKPGSSQHQKEYVAVCDIAGLSRDSGCSILKKLCDEKYNGKCGVGGYPGGGYHFGVNDYRFSSWNRCAGLPRNKLNYGSDWKPTVDPTQNTTGGSELDGTASRNHEIIFLAAIAAAGVGGVLLYKKLRKK